jgi:hypothetical protein
MPIPPANPNDTQAAIAVVVFIAVSVCAAYWRTALRVVLVAAVAIAVYGLVLGIEYASTLVTAIRHW